jgi:hypothetical protein
MSELVRDETYCGAVNRRRHRARLVNGRQFVVCLISAGQDFDQKLLAHRETGRNLPSLSRRKLRYLGEFTPHMKASFCTAKCDISPSQKDRIVRCGGSISAVTMLPFGD